MPYIPPTSIESPDNRNNQSNLLPYRPLCWCNQGQWWWYSRRASAHKNPAEERSQDANHCPGPVRGVWLEEDSPLLQEGGFTYGMGQVNIPLAHNSVPSRRPLFVYSCGQRDRIQKIKSPFPPAKSSHIWTFTLKYSIIKNSEIFVTQLLISLRSA